ncbi:U2 small nuclear ribonucleoprotein A', putative [Perkinsus marinus ATCC 50983]|uniref:U2 small nuclear ribonucleoprotein A', putative n=1 Tax=Perkinsus marinus (strain ATCC 50983 / TXsc) TaxID=423536 RepID=C5KHN5_PERM5|nr:U2 small nuclear ribonucleoprotein A', putative [Perkinsus marinus ATCC 50983]EER16097.1 U2 small nuclear ribonucleoprotein A', putative [Perkinsus marinus ATCC 50983]|eukprot:XP_002784301.1 U2 small nuclear ribonucleoprotein A', putative [Perkinsus marinus ATCC 50983]
MVAQEEVASSMDSIVKMCCAEEECEPKDLTELVIDEEDLPKITKADMSGDISKCTSLTLINFTSCGLTEIQAPFPELANVETLDLSENKLTSDVIDKLVNLSALRLLLLRGNLIDSVEEFKALRNLKSLQVIDLKECPVVKTANYRKKIFDILEQVEVIDDKGRDGDSVDMAAILGVNDEEDTDDLVAADSSDDVLCALGRDEIRRMLELDSSEEEEEIDSDPDENDKSEDEEDVDPDIPPVAKMEDDDEGSPAAKKARN